MAEWSSYSLADFLLFSPNTYFRQFELLNDEVIPVQAALLALAIAIAFLARSQFAWRGRAVGTILCVFWMSSALLYLWRHHEQINWAASYLMAGFGVQIGLMLWFGIVRDGLAGVAGNGISAAVGIALFAYAVLLFPLQAAALGRPWQQAEFIGLAPDPTVIATIATVLACGVGWRWLLLAVPLLWCAISLATLWAMKVPDFWLLAGLTALAIIGALLPSSRRPPDRA